MCPTKFAKSIEKRWFFWVFLNSMNANSIKKSKNVDFLNNCLKLWVTIRKKHRSILDKNVDLFKRSLWVGAMEARWSWAKFAQLVWVQWGIMDTKCGQKSAKSMHAHLCMPIRQENSKNVRFFKRSLCVGAMEAEKIAKLGTNKIRALDGQKIWVTIR